MDLTEASLTRTRLRKATPEGREEVKLFVLFCFVLFHEEWLTTSCSMTLVHQKEGPRWEEDPVGCKYSVREEEESEDE